MVQPNAVRLVINLVFITALYGSGCRGSSIEQQQAEGMLATSAPIIGGRVVAVTTGTDLQQKSNQCPTGCHRDLKSACFRYSVYGTGCVITGTSGNRALCCNSINTLEFAINLRAAGRCDHIVTVLAAQHIKKSMQEMHQAMIRAGSVMNILNVTAVCQKSTGTFAVPVSYKVKTKLRLVVNIVYRGNRHVRDMLVYNQKRSGSCGVSRELCQAAQQGRQFCMYDKAGSAYSCAWLAQRTAGNGSPPCMTGCNGPSPGPAPSPSTAPSPGLTSPPVPDVPTDSNGNPGVRRDQAILLATKNQLTGGDPDILSDWRLGSSMCDDHWEGIYCYDSGPEQGAVQEITLDYGLLSGQLPAAWSNLTAPVLINLEGNYLTSTLPSSWQSLTTLTTLRLAANRLSGPLPAGWSGIMGLQYLSVHNNVQLSGCMPLSFRSRKFHLYDDTGAVKSVGLGGQAAGPLNATSGVLSRTGISDWCTG